ncbi:hypothetical protein [Streptomyces nigrescens]|uniref:hypothetical protein n=1 Tax=Streptomyces nigrescens TaxID=1920 RepID=UPI0036FC7247
MLTILSAYRHRRSTRAAHRLLRNGHLWPPGKIANDITAQDLVGYMLGRYGTQISLADAQDHLDRARAQSFRSDAQQ